MKNALKLLLSMTQTYGITLTQATILLMKKHSLVVPCHPEDIKTLNRKGLLTGTNLDDKFDAKLNELERNIGKKSTKQGSNRPYRYVYTHIKEKVLPSKISTSIQGSIDNLIPEDGELKDYFTLFIHLFPSSSRDQNGTWSKHFGITYNGHKLRVVSKDAHKQFMSAARHHDPDILLLAAYRMIIDSIQPDKGTAYIMKITNFFTEWYERYLESQTLLEKHGEAIFSKVDRNISTQGNTILL